MGLFKAIANGLKKTKEAISRKLDYVFSGGELSDEFFDELEEILISADVGVKSSVAIVEELRTYSHKNKIRSADDVKIALRSILSDMLSKIEIEPIKFPAVITIVGVNGVGKTTSIGKLAHIYVKQKKDVTLVAGDTFRAAAADQLSEWAKRSKVKIVRQNEGADAASVVFDGIASAKAKGTDVLIVDTAGRLHTKSNLMQELAKIDRVVSKEYPEANRYNFIVLDATTGQNALAQISAFDESISLDGIILTKLDGTAKGGVVIAIMREFKTPVRFIGVGEGLDDMEEFDSEEFINNMF